jgi:hypothetical protein
MSISTSANHEEPSLFEPIGNTAERLAQGDQQGQHTNQSDEEGEEDVALPEGVDSIESLCMNCGKNVTSTHEHAPSLQGGGEGTAKLISKDAFIS